MGYSDRDHRNHRRQHFEFELVQQHPSALQGRGKAEGHDRQTRNHQTIKNREFQSEHQCRTEKDGFELCAFAFQRQRRTREREEELSQTEAATRN